jgi:C_GCAxxG_C_C family probable redox protein
MKDYCLRGDHIMTKGQIAKEYFAKGYNCAQSVFLAFADELGVDKTFAARLTNCLGGGLSQTGGICGAVSAGCLVFSGLYGRETESREGEQLARQQRTYRLVQEFQRRFVAEFGATGCPALLEKGLADSGDAKNNKVNCPLYVQRAAEIAEELIAGENA